MSAARELYSIPRIVVSMEVIRPGVGLSKSDKKVVEGVKNFSATLQNAGVPVPCGWVKIRKYETGHEFET